MVKKVVVRKSRIQGRGVVATGNFKKGDEILKIDDSNVITDISKLTKKELDWRDFLEHDKTVLMKVPERHINHSCDPNTYVKTIEGIRRVIAMRNIKKGEEITYDYAVNGSGGVPWKCHCGSKVCRKTPWADFFKLPKSLQVKYLPYLDDWFRKEFKERIDEIEQDEGNFA